MRETQFGATGTLMKNQSPTTGISLRNMDWFRKPGRLRQSGTKIFQARVATTGDPTAAGNEGDWHLIADTATMSSASVSEQANRRRFTDTNFWSQFTIPDPDQNSGHWQVVKENVITSSQPLGTVKMTVFGQFEFRRSFLRTCFRLG